MYREILVPTDGSPGTDAVIDNALAVAGRFDATVHAVSVVEDEEATAAAAVERVETRAEHDDVPVVTAVREGSPHRELLAYVEAADIDLVVMGTHGRTGLDRQLLGSVTDRVIRLGEVPVLAVHLGAGDGAAVEDSEAAVALAREAVADAGHDVEAVPERPYQTEGTWVVRVETEGAAFNVHVNAATGRTRVARLRGDDT